MKFELLAPAGNLTKLKTAIYFGADAVYIGGKDFSLRSYSENFTREELKTAVGFSHERGKKVYVTVNIFAKSADFESFPDYFTYLNEIGVDAVIVSDLGVMTFAKKYAPNVDIHVSTQANVLNEYTAAAYAELAAKRIILARELSLEQISKIRAYLPAEVELEAFCHGAMCISYSGRCLLSDYFTGRSSNRGQCVQACRWNYSIREKNSDGEFYDITEDEHGTYILNSKDLNMIDHLAEMQAAGVYSLKIEGRMKSEYYLATVVNAYRRAINAFYTQSENYVKDRLFFSELLKTNHRAFTTAYTLGENAETVNYEDSQSAGDKVFAAAVLGYDNASKTALIEMRNRFQVGDTLEVLTPNDYLNATIKVGAMTDEKGNAITDARLVQQKLYIKTDVPLSAGDLLRK